MKSLQIVFLGRRIAATLLREDVQHHWAVPFLRSSHCLFEGSDVMTINWAGIPNAEGLEEGAWCDGLTDGGRQSRDRGVGKVTNSRNVLQEIPQAVSCLQIGVVEPNLGEGTREVGNRRCVAPTIVIEHDENLGARVAKIIQRLVGHPTGERTVANDGHNPPISTSR